MCVVSMVMDHYKDKWNPLFPKPWDAVPYPDYPNQPSTLPGTPLDPVKINIDNITREEFDQLRRDVLEMKELVKRALKYDQDTGQPDCENEKKIALVRAVAEAVGINVDDVFGKL